MAGGRPARNNCQGCGGSGAYEVDTFQYLPFALSVESPADDTGYRAPPAVLELQNRLFREQQCSISTCGWTPHFTVGSEQDGVLGKVTELLSAAGCTVTVERRYTWEPQGNVHGTYRHHAPWERGWTPVVEKADSLQREEVVMAEAPPEPEAVILEFRPAA